MIDPVAEGTNVYSLIAMRARSRPDAPALIAGPTRIGYAELIATADAIAADLAARGIRRGDRVAILSENRIEYTLTQIACAKLGIIVACQNWRLALPELQHCIGLVEAKLLIVSERYKASADALQLDMPVADIASLGASGATRCVAEPEDGLLIIYTSGTTGLPKAAVISHRAEIARMCALRMDLNIGPEDGYVAWAPMFHMGGTEHLLAALMSGAHGIVIDGFDAELICDAIAEWRIGWLMLVPATIEPLTSRIRARGITPKGIRAVGCMADLVPSGEVADISRLTRAPYLNSFGATETGMPPLSGGLIAPGSVPASLDKQLSSLCEIRLIGPDGTEAVGDEPGEAWVRGPTLFSGYWAAEAANAQCFVDGWFRMGDLFRKTADGYAFVGRSKYLIKSGGENIYPAEIERVLLADPRVSDAIVVRRGDDRWGEVPVAVIARLDESLDAAAVETMCRAQLASYKRPRDVVFVALEAFPRSASGKIVREEVEKMIG
ncbi:MAG: acid--CoA ligase [Alphaproteobacteria bacterium]|nr:acid--CoA ligase [Alphaproteobacteria bacterium]